MQAVLELYRDQFLIFTLVLARVSGLVLTAPVFGTREIPIQVRGLFAFSLAALVAPLQFATPIEYPHSVFNYLTFVGVEVMVGLVFGMGIMILFTGVQVAGRLIGQASGMALAEVASPGTNDSVPIHAQLLNLLTLAVFVTVGGHRLLIAAMLDTFEVLPAGHAAIPMGIGDTITTLLTQSFSLGIRAAAPVLMALLLSTVVMGLISRTMPQFNILAVGFGLNSMIALATLSLTLGTIAYLFHNHVEGVLDLMTTSIVGTG